MKTITMFTLFCFSFLTFLIAQTEIDKEPIKKFHQNEMKQRIALMQKDIANVKAETPNQKNFDVKFYSLDLELDPENKLISGKLTVLAQVISDTLSIMQLDLDSVLQVTATYMDTQSVDFSHDQSLITVYLPKIYSKDDFVEFTVEYSGTPNQNPDPYVGFIRFNFDYYKNKPLIYSIVSVARNWWPCKDNITDKADSMAIKITVPSNLIVVSNGTLKSVEDNDSTKSYFWFESHPISTDLMGIAAYPYQIESDWYKYTEVDSMTITNYYVPETFEKFDKYFSKTTEMLQLFSDLFGLYPFIDEKYSNVVFGLDNVGMSLQTFQCISYNLQENRLEYVTAHELSHSWWGMRNSSDYHHTWLLEGFATYSGMLWFEFTDRKIFFDAWMGNMTQLIGPGTIYWDDYENGSYWDKVPLFYYKGAWVLHMLRHILGDSTFFQVLKNYAQAPELEQKVITTEDFQNYAENISGLDLDYFFKQWIYKEGYPFYHYAWQYEQNADSTYSVSVRIQQIQEQKEGFDTVFDMPVDIQIRDATYPLLTTHTVRVNSLDTTVQFVHNLLPVYVYLDYGNNILCKKQRVTWTSIHSDFSTDIFTKYRLSQNYPNPFNPSTVIKYQIPKVKEQINYNSQNSNITTLIVYDILGRVVATLVNEQQKPGYYEIKWDANNQTSGVYFYQLISSNFVESKKMVLIR